MTLNCDLDLPAYGIGDEKRLMQTILNVAGNAIKFTKEGYVSVQASILSSEYAREWETPEFCPTSIDGLFYLLVQVSMSVITRFLFMSVLRKLINVSLIAG